MSNSVVDQEQQVVVFRLDSEAYAIDIFRINEIIRLREITPVPQTGAHIRGLVNLRGKTIPVVDLRVRLCLSRAPDEDRTRIIVVESEQGNVGIVVDEVCEVITLSNQQLEPAPAMVAGSNVDFVKAIVKQGERLITFLDLDRALAA